MALSQIQCLDDNHVNPRTHESKPEFLYSEEQRGALETLLRDGREAFLKHLDTRGLRGFLSDLELEALAGAVEPYDSGSELYREDTDDEETPLSLHYWPDMSDMSTPRLDLGWPDSEAYRGVTRTTVYTQPPLDGQAHIKEVIRKMIAQAQKVIAVVMDVFTDVDIFRDLLDASFKRKVSVYILLERTSIPHFLSMCQRANMHSGHLKNLRVRSSEGTEFYTHSCTKVRGRMGHRFMFVDGDKAVSGSYNFTWMSSRLDRNLITVVTGQAVDAFDRLFRFLFTASKQVNLRRVVTEPEPEPDPIPQPTSVAPPSAAVARKLYNPKYALVAAGNASLSPSPSAGNNSPKESQKDTKNEETNKKGRRKMSKDVPQEAPPLHPGLVDLEKAYLYDYLPTWPEPDPSSDVIGFINIRDTRKPTQVHLQRSEMFEVSQAIRFSSPITRQKETLPEVAKPRNLSAAKHEENPPQQNKAEQKTPLEPIAVKTKELPQSESDKENVQAPNKESNLQSNPTTTANKNALHSSTPNLYPQTSEQSVKSVTTPTVTADSPETATVTRSQTSLSSKSALQYNSNGTESNQSSKLLAPSDSNSKIQKHSSSENLPSSTGNILSAVTATTTSASANYRASEANTVHSGLTSASPTSTLTTISTSAPPLTTTSITPSSTPSLPVPKPRTVQLVIKDPSPSNGQKIPEVSMVKKPNSPAKTKLTTIHNEPLVASVLPRKEPEIVPEVANKSASKSIPPKTTEDTGKVCLQGKESRASQEVRREKAAVPHNEKAVAQQVASNKVIAQTNAIVKNSPTEAVMNIQKVTQNKEEESMGKINKADRSIKTTESPLRSSGIAKDQSPTRTYHARAYIPQRISYSSSEENIDALKSPIDRSPKLKAQHKAESTPTITVDTQKADILPHANESVLRTAKCNSHTTPLSPRAAPEKPTFLHPINSQITDSKTPEKESRTPSTPKHNTILEGLPPRVSTPDFRIHTPDLRSHTPDFKTPTSDISDVYGSTTSDEYYECSESPFHESILDKVPFHSLEDQWGNKNPTVSNNPGNDTSDADMLSNEDRTMSSSETLNLSVKGSLSSILERLGEEEKATEEKNVNEPDQEKKIKKEVTEASKEVEKVDVNLQQTLNELPVDKDCPSQSTESNKVLTQAAVVDLSLTPSNEATEAKQKPVRELKPKKVYPKPERPDRIPAGGEKTTVDRATLSPASVERPQATKEPEGQKQQKDSGVPSYSRPAQPFQPLRRLSAAQASLVCQEGNRTERKMSDDDLQVLDSSSPSRRLPPRPPPPATASKPLSPNQHYQLPPTSPFKTKLVQMQNPFLIPKPQPSFLYTQTQMQNPHISAQHQNQAMAIQEGLGQDEEKTAFGITFSKLYNLKGLKDKMSKLPTQNRRGSTSSSAQPRKSTG